MRRVFADALYWVALAHRKDQRYRRAVQVSQQLGRVSLVTTDEVFDEFLGHFRAFGSQIRGQAARTVRDLMSDPATIVLPQSRQTFLAGLDLYEARPDKQYSLTDCISIETMRREGLIEVLTHDAHFTQKGFVLLL